MARRRLEAAIQAGKAIQQGNVDFLNWTVPVLANGLWFDELCYKAVGFVFLL